MQMKLRALEHIRFFDAAARSRSFKDAALALSVTPAAVSQRIRQLENELGVVLFERRVRQVELTEEGRLFSIEVAKSLDILDRATERIAAGRESRAVTISTTPTFAEQILLPVLGKLHERVEDRVVRVVVSTDIVDPGTNGIDLAVRQGRGRYPGFKVRKLMACDYAPVCSPQLLNAGKTAPLVHVDWPKRVPEPPTWDRWVAEMGALPFQARGEVHVTSEAMAIRSAVSGQGHALVALPHVINELRIGVLTLTAGKGNAMASCHDYYLVEPVGRLRKSAEDVGEWLIKQFS